MNYNKLSKLNDKLYFTAEDISELLGIKYNSALVMCTRYVKNGSFIRLKNNFYILTQTWKELSQEKLFKTANILQVPSYISLNTALSYYGVTTQVQRDYFESISLKRQTEREIAGKTFNYYKIAGTFYTDFVKQNDIFIASKEKAFIDAVYLYSFGKYRIDFNALDYKKLDISRIKKIINRYSDKTKRIMKKLCKI
ncbi:MAG: hypothetical protein A3J83_03680 [Elusimicrobia bacterium RIFOXYA2_FULL_40_6]|nr:MAG: hypothetical protein A3J83_03680 [Elusimicrobia bacterium RIFOXYA2_FULL_40_6]